MVGTISNRGVAFIAAWEGPALQAYCDTAGILTIGYGHTTAAGAPVVTAGMKITQAQSEQILAADLAPVDAEVNRLLPGCTQPVHDGAGAFHFNTGELEAASWVTLWKQGDFVAAEAHLKLWNKDKDPTTGALVVVQGLVNRRAAEADMIFRGIYRGPGGETIAPQPGANP